MAATGGSRLAHDDRREALATAPLGTARLTLLVVFALSGFSGLIYESIWSHYLKLFLGHAAYAQTLVLAIFMGGMAIGAAAAARWSTRLARPVLAYAGVELLIGLLAIVFDREFQALLRWSFDSVLPTLGSATAIQAFKWSAGAVLILPQSILLGMTFPMIGSGLTRTSDARSGELIALLYFSNCLGATVGVLTSGFYLVGHFGLPGTLLVAAAVNLVVALLAWAAGGRLTTSPPTPETNPVAVDRTAVGVLELVALGTGLASFLYEIAWIRMLTLALGSSTHSFELMLAAFIVGLAAGGGWIRRRIDALATPMRTLGTLLACNAALAALTIAGYHYSFDVVAWAKSAFAPTPTGYTGFNVVAQVVAGAIMVPVTFFCGMTLPLVTHICLRRGTGESAVGRIYAINTVGCILGVVVAIHLLMPTFGVKWTVLAGAGLTLLLAFVVVARAHEGATRAGAPVGPFAAAAVVALVAIAVHPDPRRMTSAVYRTGAVSIPADSQVTYLRDGKTATISLVERDGMTVIATNGKPDAAIQTRPGPPADDEVTMILAGALPLALHPEAKRIANIGIGSGLTSAVLLASPDVQELVSIEIEPFMVEAAARGYRPRTDRLFDDPRSRIVIEDAKTYFASHPTRFDVIVSEPSNPWVSGVATLFSAEFYRQVRRYIADDGLLVQWIQVYETDPTVVWSILKALSPAFADYQLYDVDDSNILVIASPARRLGNPTDRIFHIARMQPELLRAGLRERQDLTGRRIGDKALLDPYVQRLTVPVNSDYFPWVDQNAARFRFMNRNALPIVNLTTLPVPFLELARPDWTTDSPRTSSPYAKSYRELAVDRAVVVAAEVGAGQGDRLPPALAASAATLQTSATECASRGARQGWSNAVTLLSDQTTALLPYADLEAMWRRIEASGCYQSATAGQRAWPDFLHAVARRDHGAIERTGAGLLQQAALRDDPDRAGRVILAVGAALRGAGRCRDASAFVGATARTLHVDPKYALPLGILAADCPAG